MTPLDWLILAFTLAMAVWGYAQGLVVGALSLAGFAGGAFLGSRLGPLLLNEGSASPFAPAVALVSALLIIVGLFIRLKISESPVFQRAMEEQEQRQEEAQLPVIEAIKTYPKTIGLAMGSFIGTHATFYIASVYMIAYATEQVGYERTTVLNANALLSAADLLMILGFGALSDYVGRRPLFLAGMAILALFAFPYLWLVNTGTIALFILGGLVIQACRSAVYGPQSAYFSELFSTRMRYSGASLSYQFAAILGGGFAPLIATALVAWTGSYVGVAVYIMVVALISLVSSYLLTETFGKDLEEQAPRRPTGRPVEQSG